ncbi:MAG: serpin family protein [Oscillospiraceae bacterium]|nr:serpin family protein [Oscillospiraceae bacterium]
MKKEELFEVLGDIDPDSVAKARAYERRKRPAWRAWVAVAAALAVVVGAIWGVPAMRNIRGNGSGNYPSGLTTVLAAYPEPTAKTLSAQEFMEGDGHWNWWSSYRELVSATEDLQSGMEACNMALMARLLASENENTVCSPLNAYIAFAMLAEVSDGNTRQQILDMLGAADIETLRANVSALWKSNYVDTPVLKSLLANSVWLNGGVKYEKDTLRSLAENYYASSFSGTPGSPEMDEALRTWTDSNTGGPLSDHTKDMSLDPDTVLAILSTIYYKAMWTEEFSEKDTTREIFHGTSGDTAADMMHRTDTMGVYRSDRFLSVGLGLNDSGAMYFFLPDEGTDVNALLSDPNVGNALRYDETDQNRSTSLVHLSVPKFKVTCKNDLIETVRALGVTDALDPARSDFTPLTEERDGLYLSKAEHAAVIEIDEHGVTGAAYTELSLSEGAALPDDEIDFVLDRPFMFIVTGRDGSILFSGIVRNID